MATDFNIDEYLTDLIAPEKEKEKVSPPSKYAVIFNNDDFTPMPFVVTMLMLYFDHSLQAATHIMMEVHAKGKGTAGIYSRDIAETKASMVQQHATKEEHPLLVTIEPIKDD